MIPHAKITKLKDGTTHLAHKNEHAVDLDTSAIVAPAVHPADRGRPDDAHGAHWSRRVHRLQEVREDETVRGRHERVFMYGTWSRTRATIVVRRW